MLLACLGGEILFRIVPFERLKYEARYGHFSGNEVGRFLEYDPVLTFRNRRGARFPDAGVAINSLGLRGVEVSATKAPGTKRILCLGDSCTFGAARPYPEILQSILDRRHGEGRYEVLNGGVIGYTSLHGLEWFRRELAALDPDVVTIYFGWNDMWREKDSAIREWFLRRVRNEETTTPSYLWAAISRGAVYLRNRSGVGEVPIQIPPERYREILGEFARLGAEKGFTPVFVTAPAGFVDGRGPGWMIERGFVAAGDSAPALRETYNRIVLEVAREHVLPVADCAADFSRQGGPKLFDRPADDPIHPGDRGYRRIAQVLADAVSLTGPTSASASR